MLKKEYCLNTGDRTITAQFNDLADQANGSVILSCEETVVMATVVMSNNTKDGLDYFPLSVEYEEKFYAAGKILGGRFTRREGRPSTSAILSGRMIDRTIRPFFEQHIRNEVQVVITILSLGRFNPDILAINAVSLAIATSDIPWNGPVSGAEIGINSSGKILINPPFKPAEEKVEDQLNLIACGKDGNFNMIEIKSNEISDELIIEALEKASQEIEAAQEFQKKIIQEIGKEKITVEKPKLTNEAVELFKNEVEPQLEKAVFNKQGGEKIEKLKNDWLKICAEKTGEENTSLPLAFYEQTVDNLIHKEALDNNRRTDERAMDEIRPLFAQAGGMSPMAHGTGIFYRGGTHVFSALTLGGKQSSLLLDEIRESQEKRFIHHYNFPPFSTGETGRISGMNRRMIGHGVLAEKALLAILPSEEKFPYVIRIVSESMASNGSTSMASTCAATLALMDAGVPIKAPVAGIAMGLMMRNKDDYKILTDIQGPEDHYGDMDFKVTGTKNGLTAAQMDIKVDGVPLKILSEALEQAKKARLQILDIITKEISEPRSALAPHAPKIITMKIKPEQIGGVIGPGGKVINHIKDATGVEEIDIDDDGNIYITGKDTTTENAQKMIEAITKVYAAGDRFEGEVVKIFDFGAVVKIGPNAEGLVHISEIAPFHTKDINTVLKEGMKVPVIIKESNGNGKIKLSIKDADPNFVKKETVEKTSSHEKTKPKTAQSKQKGS